MNLKRLELFPNSLPEEWKELVDMTQLLSVIRQQDPLPEVYKEEKRHRREKKRDLLLSSGVIDEAGLVQVKEIRNVLEDTLGIV